MCSLDSLETIEAIDAISEERRNAVISCSERLIAKGVPGLSRREIIKAVNLISAEEREEVIENAAALALFTPEMSATDRAAMIKAVNEVPVNQRDAVVTASLSLIPQGRMGAKSRAEIIEDVADEGSTKNQPLLKDVGRPRFPVHFSEVRSFYFEDHSSMNGHRPNLLFGT